MVAQGGVPLASADGNIAMAAMLFDGGIRSTEPDQLAMWMNGNPPWPIPPAPPQPGDPPPGPDEPPFDPPGDPVPPQPPDPDQPLPEEPDSDSPVGPA